MQKKIEAPHTREHITIESKYLRIEKHHNENAIFSSISSTSWSFNYQYDRIYFAIELKCTTHINIRNNKIQNVNVVISLSWRSRPKNKINFFWSVRQRCAPHRKPPSLTEWKKGEKNQCNFHMHSEWATILTMLQQQQNHCEIERFQQADYQ